MRKPINKKLIAFWVLVFVFSAIAGPTQASTVTWKVDSPADTYNRPDLNPSYDIEDVSVAIFDNDSDNLWFYLWFKNVPFSNMFNDGKGSWAGIFIDSNFDGKEDLRLTIAQTSMTTDRTAVEGYVYNFATGSRMGCQVSVYNNIDARSYYVAFKTTRSCLNLRTAFDVRGYSDFVSNDDKSFDYAPTNYFTVVPPGTQAPSTSGSATSGASSGKYFDLPSNIQNSSTEAVNYARTPIDLTSLSKSIQGSVVTISCGNGSGTGWSGSNKLSSQLEMQGFQSYIFTNHHVVDECVASRKVEIKLSDGQLIQGEIVAWNEINDVAGIAIKTTVPALEWIGKAPQQGWWVGVLGSPLGSVNLLTTGIISSVNASENKFTITAPINPGNSGGPVFDVTGRVIGLATSKRLLSSGELAEGFGIAHGTPLLCGSIILCESERNPWAGTPKFKEGPTAEELAAIARAEAEAKAKSEAEAAARAKVDLELRLLGEKRLLCNDFNGDLLQTNLRLSIAKDSSKSNASLFEPLIKLVPNQLDCDGINLEAFDGQLSIQRKLLGTFQLALDEVISKAEKLQTNGKKITITCLKGKVIKTVTAVNPKCPKGYKKK